MSERMSAKLVCDALQMAYWRRRPAPGLLMHSDRGCQYASAEYRKLLKQFHMTQSMSRKGNCWNNAPTESFFKTLKVERTYRLRYTSRHQVRLDIVNWIEGFYNETSALGDRLSVTRGLRTQPESCISLKYVESRQGHIR
jgi:putative transposase